VTNVIHVLLIHKIVRPSNAGKIAYLTQYPRSFGTADLNEIMLDVSKTAVHPWQDSMNEALKAIPQTHAGDVAYTIKGASTTRQACCKD